MKAILPLLFLMAAGAVTLVLAGCSLALPARTQEGARDTAIPPTASLDTPAIDARAPEDLETATFALG